VVLYAYIVQEIITLYQIKWISPPVMAIRPATHVHLVIIVSGVKQEVLAVYARLKKNQNGTHTKPQ
jgi:hypothetical protein